MFFSFQMKNAFWEKKLNRFKIQTLNEFHIHSDAPVCDLKFVHMYYRLSSPLFHTNKSDVKCQNSCLKDF